MESNIVKQEILQIEQLTPTLLSVKVIRFAKKYWLFGPIQKTVTEYRGQYDLWCHYPSLKPCNVWTRGWLSKIWSDYEKSM